MCSDEPSSPKQLTHEGRVVSPLLGYHSSLPTTVLLDFSRAERSAIRRRLSLALGRYRAWARYGAGLAVVNPAWMRFAAKARPGRFAQFAQRIFGLSATDKDDMSPAMEGIDKFEDFLRSIDCPTRLSELGIGEELFTRYAEDAVLVVHDENGNLPGRPPMSKEDIIEVLRSAR